MQLWTPTSQVDKARFKRLACQEHQAERKTLREISEICG